MSLYFLFFIRPGIALANEEVTPLARGDEKIVSLFALASSPAAATIILGIFAILVAAVAYVLVGIILFTIFAYR
ncbi:MAG: hypothetical protein AB1352_00145 [Patescibacteria group bacterium]